MALHSSILTWKIPWTEEPGGLHTVHGVARVGHDLATKPTNQCYEISFLPFMASGFVSCLERLGSFHLFHDDE